MKKVKENQKFRFIDLFCGIGGFHQALVENGGECVFACDIDEQCRRVYSNNFCPNEEFPVEGDIRLAIDNNSIPEFDFLCGGFPCQTFSKAGKRNGFEVITRKDGSSDERGQLFFRIIDILQSHPECKYILLENVRNLSDNKDNWSVICEELKRLDFIISEEPIVESPHHFGVPQIRDRVYILGIKRSHFDNRHILPKGYISRELLGIDRYLQPCNNNVSCIESIVEVHADPKYLVSEDLNQVLVAWEDLRTNTKDISRPFWLQYAGIGVDNTEFYSGSTVSFCDMPEWKKKMVMKMRTYYVSNQQYVDQWVLRYFMKDKSLLLQKFEWNAGENYSMKDCIIQVRQSGIRVKRPNYFPSLVAMNNTCIIWDYSVDHYRYLTPRECAKLQSFKDGFKFSSIDNVSYRQLGNSVNVKILSILAKELLKLGKKF